METSLCSNARDDMDPWTARVSEAEAGAPALDVYTAASLGDDRVVREALRSDPELALTRNDQGWSPLMFAVWQGHDELVSALLEAARRCGQHPATDPAVGRLPRSGRSLLMVAARFAHLRIAEALGQPKVLEVRDFRGQTALFHAVLGGNEGIFRMLMARGADVNACDLQGQTVLRLAERRRSVAMCQLLRSAGACLDPIVKAPQLSVYPARPMEVTLINVLEGLSLQKYIALFELHRVDLQHFLTMTEDDLRRLGVSLLGPRRKMALEIHRWRSLLGMDTTM